MPSQPCLQCPKLPPPPTAAPQVSSSGLVARAHELPQHGPPQHVSSPLPPPPPPLLSTEGEQGRIFVILEKGDTLPGGSGNGERVYAFLPSGATVRELRRRSSSSGDDSKLAVTLVDGTPVDDDQPLRSLLSARSATAAGEAAAMASDADPWRPLVEPQGAAGDQAADAGAQTAAVAVSPAAGGDADTATVPREGDAAACAVSAPVLRLRVATASQVSRMAARADEENVGGGGAAVARVPSIRLCGTGIPHDGEAPDAGGLDARQQPHAASEGRPCQESPEIHARARSDRIRSCAGVPDVGAADPTGDADDASRAQLRAHPEPVAKRDAPALLDYCRELLFDETAADLQLVVGDAEGNRSERRVPAHRLVLCRLPYFQQLLKEAPAAEPGRPVEVVVPSVPTEDVLRRVLRYAYTDDAEEVVHTLPSRRAVAELHAIADTCGLPLLRQECEKRLRSPGQNEAASGCVRGEQTKRSEFPAPTRGSSEGPRRAEVGGCGTCDSARSTCGSVQSLGLGSDAEAAALECIQHLGTELQSQLVEIERLRYLLRNPSKSRRGSKEETTESGGPANARAAEPNCPASAISCAEEQAPTSIDAGASGLDKALSTPSVEAPGCHHDGGQAPTLQQSFETAEVSRPAHIAHASALATSSTVATTASSALHSCRSEIQADGGSCGGVAGCVDGTADCCAPAGTPNIAGRRSSSRIPPTAAMQSAPISRGGSVDARSASLASTVPVLPPPPPLSPPPVVARPVMTQALASPALMGRAMVTQPVPAPFRSAAAGSIEAPLPRRSRLNSQVGVVTYARSVSPPAALPRGAFAMDRRRLMASTSPPRRSSTCGVMPPPPSVPPPRRILIGPFPQVTWAYYEVPEPAAFTVPARGLPL